MARKSLWWLLAGTMMLYLLSRTKKGETMSAALIEKIARLITGEEGERLTVYQDTGGAWTVGKGHLILPGEGLFPYGDRRAITKAESDSFFEKDTSIARNAVADGVHVPITENMRAALASLVFNIGRAAFLSSTLLRRLNAGDKTGAASEFDRWVWDNGVRVPGLVARRAREKALFLS